MQCIKNVHKLRIANRLYLFSYTRPPECQVNNRSGVHEAVAELVAVVPAHAVDRPTVLYLERSWVGTQHNLELKTWHFF